MSIRIRPFDIVVFSGEQLDEPGKWLVAVGCDEGGGVVIAEADGREEATRFIGNFNAALKAAKERTGIDHD